jgi:hypothetical protein
MPSADDPVRYRPRATEDGTKLPVRGAVVWYADGSKLQVTPDTWADAPSDGIVLVQVFYDHVDARGRWIQDVLHRFDYYWEHEGYFYVGRGYQVTPGTPSHKLKNGAAVTDKRFVEMYNEASKGVLADQG